MLQRLTSEDIAKWWSNISEALSLSFPPTVEHKDNSVSNILQALIDGRMQCWMEVQEGKALGIVTTAIVEEPFSGTCNLLIYSFFSHNMIADQWRDGLNTVREYAKSRKCYKIIAFVDKDRVATIAEKLGGKVINVLVEFNLEN